MIFASFPFLLFLLVVLLLVLIIPGQRPRKVVLLLASYFFYGYWDGRFLILIWISTLVDAAVGKVMYQTDEPRRRKFLFAISLSCNLGLLGFFKYYNFFIESAAAAFFPAGASVNTLDIILPVGISFYTFQTLSYTIDIYRGTLKPADTLMDFAIFVSFFPQLVAGPIVRASEFLPQLQRKIAVRGHNVWAGAQIFTVGLFKKLVIADNLAPFIDGVYGNPDIFSSSTVWLAVIAYSIQIYCDFSGYSDMAIGTARMLGFTLPRNFHMPRISTSIAEFWRRWHITLSRWLRDYVYIPLGGSRKGNFRTYVNIVITFLLGGLWHGADWTFVLWGGANGLALALNRYYSKNIHLKPTIPGIVLAWILTLLFGITSGVLFRAPTMQIVEIVYGKMLFLAPAGIQWTYHWFFVAVLMMVAGHLIGLHREREGKMDMVFFDSPDSLRAATAMSATLLVIYILAPTTTDPFIYFQF